DGMVRLWNTAEGKELRALKGHTGQVSCVAFSLDGKRLASADSDGKVKLWDTATGQELRTFTGHTQGVYSVGFSPDGTRLASASWDGTVKVRDARPLTSNKAEIEAMALLEQLFAKPLPTSAVHTAIEKQVILTEATRRKALELTGCFQEETDPQKY